MWVECVDPMGLSSKSYADQEIMVESTLITPKVVQRFDEMIRSAFNSFSAKFTSRMLSINFLTLNIADRYCQ